MQQILSESTYTIVAVHSFSQTDFGSKGNVSNDLIPDDDRNAGGLPQFLKVSKGTRIMLIRNIYTKRGLVNGAMGYVVHITLNKDNKPCIIHIKFDDEDIGKILQNTTLNNSISIEPICQGNHYKGRSIIREQFPLILSWACTIHKVQGASLDEAVISIGNDIFQPCMSYVALSRVKTLQGLYISSFNPDKVKPFPEISEEYARLRAISNRKNM